MKVREIMHRDLVTVSPDAPMRTVPALMQSRGVRHLLVTEGDRLLGMLTDRDVRHAAFLPMLAGHLPWEARRLGAPRVRDIMNWSVVTIDADAELDRAALLMFERRIGSLPVTEQGRLVGILTDQDILDTLRGEAEVGTPPELFLG